MATPLKKTSVLERSLPIVAQALGRKQGVRVIIGQSDNACTTGKDIYLPALPLNKMKAEIYAYGYIDHESGHIRFTDFSVKFKCRSSLENTFRQIFEDIRIEQAIGKKYPGCKMNIGRLVKAMVDDGKFEKVDTSNHPAMIVVALTLYRCRHDILNQHALADLARQATEVANQVIPAGAMVRLTGLMSKARTLSDSDAALSLARDVITCLEEEQDKESQKSSDDSSTDTGNDSGSDSADSNDDAGTDTGNDSGSDSADSNDDAGTNTGNDSGSDSADSNDDAGTDTGNDSGSGTGAAEILQEIVDAKDADLMNTDIAQLAAEQLDEMADQSDYPVVVGTDSGYAPPSGLGDNLFNEAARHSSFLRARLNGLLQSQKMVRSSLTDSGKELSQNHLYRVAVNDIRVFKKKKRKAGINTAVSILLDRSGSMNGDKSHVSKTALIAVAHALSMIQGVSVSCSAFPGQTGHDVERITDFGQSPRLFAERFDIHPQGGTPLAQAMWWTATQLSRCSEPRKLLLVITDGEPNDYHRSLASITQLIELCDQSQIECIALGIGELKIAEAFPVHSTIKDVNQLADALFDLIKQKMLFAA